MSTAVPQSNPKVLLSFLYIEDSNPVLVFADAADAKTFSAHFHGQFRGAEIYGIPNHVFLPK